MASSSNVGSKRNTAHNPHDLVLANHTSTKERMNEEPARERPALCADYRGVVALRLPRLGECGGADLGSDHLARHYQLDASILLTAFRGTI